MARTVRLAALVLAAPAVACSEGASPPAASPSSSAPATGVPTTPAVVPTTPTTTPAATAMPVLREEFDVVAECDENGSTLAMAACAQRDTLAAGAELNKHLATLWGLDEAGRAALVAAHEAWVTYRRAACASFAALETGGSLATVEHAHCLALVTRQRAELLRAQAEEAAGT